jgi:hypothetical protein
MGIDRSNNPNTGRPARTRLVGAVVPAGYRSVSQPPDPEYHRVLHTQSPLAATSAWDGDQWLFYLTMDEDLITNPRVAAALDQLQQVCQAERAEERARAMVRIILNEPLR